MMKKKIGPYTVSYGKYPSEYNWGVPEFTISGPRVWIDVDWTDSTFPIGWCAGFGFGRKQDGTWPWSGHWSWNAPFSEPNRASIRIPGWAVDFSLPTWWTTVLDSITAGTRVNRYGRPVPVIRTHDKRTRPHLADGWPMVSVKRTSKN